MAKAPDKPDTRIRCVCFTEHNCTCDNCHEGECQCDCECRHPDCGCPCKSCIKGHKCTCGHDCPAHADDGVNYQKNKDERAKKEAEAKAKAEAEARAKAEAAERAKREAEAAELRAKEAEIAAARAAREAAQAAPQAAPAVAHNDRRNTDPEGYINERADRARMEHTLDKKGDDKVLSEQDKGFLERSAEGMKQAAQTGVKALKGDVFVAGKRILSKQLLSRMGDAIVAVALRRANGIKDRSEKKVATKRAEEMDAFFKTDFGKMCLAGLISLISTPFSKYNSETGEAENFIAELTTEMRRDTLANVGDQLVDVVLDPLVNVAKKLVAGTEGAAVTSEIEDLVGALRSELNLVATEESAPAAAAKPKTATAE